jgi:nucleotide-binding universal stress UspA family protein
MQVLKTILCPTDFSDLAINAFHAAHALALAHKARLILLYVEEPQEVVEGEFGAIPPEPEPSDEGMFARLRGLLPEGSPVQADTLVARGPAVASIIEAAKRTHSDLIVMGTHGRKGLSRLFHRSLADAVTRQAPCPVMALRSSQTEEDVPTPGS